MRFPSWGGAVTNVVETTPSHLLSRAVRPLKKEIEIASLFRSNLFLLVVADTSEASKTLK